MKITKQKLRQIIKEELSAGQIEKAKELFNKRLISKEEYEKIINPELAKTTAGVDPLAGKTTAGVGKVNDLSGQTRVDEPDSLSGKTTAGAGKVNDLSGQTRVDEPQNVKNKAVALDKVESLLSNLLQQIRQL